MPEQWWITTGELAKGGTKILGPFGTRELALEVRTYVEKVRAPLTFWVASEEVPAENLSTRMDELFAELPEDAWTISHDEEADYRVCTVVIDWRKVPGQDGSQLQQRAGKLRLIPDLPRGSTSG